MANFFKIITRLCVFWASLLAHDSVFYCIEISYSDVFTSPASLTQILPFCMYNQAFKVHISLPFFCYATKSYNFSVLSLTWMRRENVLVCMPSMKVPYFVRSRGRAFVEFRSGSVRSRDFSLSPDIGFFRSRSYPTFSKVRHMINYFPRKYSCNQINQWRIDCNGL